jgi:hypothetical protein
MRYLLAILLTLLTITAQAAPRERLVLMPVHVPTADAALAGAIEAAAVEGLSHSYVVYAGERVAKRTREAFARSSKQGVCDETICLQRIAESFQSERVAIINVVHPGNDYFLTITVRNVFDDQVDKSTTITCRFCDMGEVIARFKDLFGRHAAPAIPAEPIWTLAPTAMVWQDANEYCRSVGAHLPSLDELREFHVNSTLQEQARIQWNGPVWSSYSETRGVHFMVAPLQNTMIECGDIGRVSTACVR